MDVNFWIIQAIGVGGWLLLIGSYYGKNTNGILFFQILGTVLYCIHYYLLDAYSGLFICSFEVLRDYLYYKTDYDNYIFLASVPIYIIESIFSFNKWFDLLPVFSSLLDGFSLTKRKKIVVVGAVISYTSWVIYDLFVLSISGAITDGLIVLSNLSILLFDFNPFEALKRD